MHDFVRNARRFIVNEKAEEVTISSNSCHSILTEDLEMQHFSAKLVP
jgi:hypothetical protein